jgi:hypothetical protein
MARNAAIEVRSTEVPLASTSELITASKNRGDPAFFQALSIAAKGDGEASEYTSG